MTDLMIGDRAVIELPYSEVCMHMRVAGRRMAAVVLAGGVQLYSEDGAPFSFPITHGEAGVRVISHSGTREWVFG